MLALTLVGAVAAAVVFRLVSGDSRASYAIGVGLVAVVLPSWIVPGVTAPITGGLPAASVHLMPWLAAVLVGVALGWAGWAASVRIAGGSAWRPGRPSPPPPRGSPTSRP